MKTTIGIIGFGFMGYQHYKQCIPKTEDFCLAGLYDIEPARLEFARELGINTYNTREEILADQSINVILVATSNQTHKEIAIAALKAGKNVICEKPCMMNAAELEEVLAVANEKGLLFTVHQNRRMDKDYRIVKEALASGVIGRPAFIESRVQGANGIPSDWRRQQEFGGGMLLDWGVHLLDQLMMMIDEPIVQVTAVLQNLHYGVDDNIKILLHFESGISAQIDVMTVCFQPLPRWHVIGDKGTLNIEGWDCTGSIICGSVEEVDWSLDALKHKAGTTRTMRPRPKSTTQTHDLPQVPEDNNGYYRNIHAALQGTEAPWVTQKQALRLMNLLDMCFESSAQRKSISCNL